MDREIRVEQVSWGVDGHAIINDIDLNVVTGNLVGLIGPNGSGKTSLLRCVYHVLRPKAGIITLDGEDVWQQKPQATARKMAVVLQESPAEFDFTVWEMVMMGRSPHKGMFDRNTYEDNRLVVDALNRVDMASFAERSFLTLSGGERQRVLVARALAQKTRYFLLDEPTNHLDIRYQLEILELVKGLGVTAIVALHDLNLAALYCDKIYVLDKGQIIASGDPEIVIQPDLVQRVYHVSCEVQTHPSTGRPHIIFFPENYVKE
ncbi:MAG: ABC transporter ATP-binding protein [Chloroflexota bacterium]|nr:ABC transporter ATP-binding protein [Chloroflexota bacterium]